MAPGYKPLAATAPTGLTALAYQTPLDDWDDISKTNALIRAQRLANETVPLQQEQLEIANEANRILLEQKQRDLDFEKKFAAEYNAQHPNMDPEDPNILDPVFSTESPMDLAARLAAEGGQFDRMVELEKIQNSPGALSRDPVSESTRLLMEQFSGREIPEGTSLRELDVGGRLLGKNIYEQQTANKQERYEKEQLGKLPEGVEVIQGTISDKDASEVKNLLAGTQEVRGILSALKESLSRSGTEAATGADYVIQKQLVGDLAFILKSPAFGNLGAALGPGERELLATQLPALFASPGASLGGILVQRGLGRDPFDAIQALENKMTRILKDKTPIFNARITPGYFGTPKETPENNTQIRDVDPPPGVNEALSRSVSGPGSAGTDGRSPEAIAYKEKVKASKLAELRAQAGQ